MALAPDDPALATLDVYWRPGCGFCDRLFRALRAAGVPVRLHNIWEDPDARKFVQAHNGGHETVPTVTLAGATMTNPDPKALIATLKTRYPDLVKETSSGWHPFQRSAGQG